MTLKMNANLYGYVRKFSLSNSLIDSRKSICFITAERAVSFEQSLQIIIKADCIVKDPLTRILNKTILKNGLLQPGCLNIVRM